MKNVDGEAMGYNIKVAPVSGPPLNIMDEMVLLMKL